MTGEDKRFSAASSVSNEQRRSSSVSVKATTSNKPPYEFDNGVPKINPILVRTDPRGNWKKVTETNNSNGKSK